MEKSYDPKQVELRWYQVWLEQGYFTASVDAPADPYCIVIPPPNITGSLHMGHALNNTLQDILIRWRRMQGLNTLWVPGTDHAGIATQNVVERHFMEEEGLSREDLGREKFIQRIENWRSQHGETIIEQLKRLGASCDWSRLRFTMDKVLSKAVLEVFVRLYEDGLIYRGERLINWCPHCLTALSDIEVEHEDTTGKLYHIQYPLADDPATRLTVATTRPETMLGDTAVAVHPEDPRYNRFIGKKIKLPLTNRAIPVVGDPLLVDREFGTGAVKITPAHDFNDFEAGNRHNLERISILDQHARMDPLGLRDAAVEDAIKERIVFKSVREARTLVVEALKKSGFLVKVEDHAMALGKCYRCKTVVEPYLSPQWFVKIQPLAEPAIKAVESGQIRLIPEQWTNNYLGWMRDIKDWCISRQIWWGHQIPAWYCKHCNEDAILETGHGVGATAEGGRLPAVSKRSFTITPEAKPIVAKQAPSHCPDCGHSDPMIQDPDVLDTWFSSALWPFSTLGWPDQTPELKKFYPTSTLVTGFDILFFWVARMIMMGLKFMGQVPFRHVYIHALVRDAEGQKMSKSKGNVIDPLEVMDKYGTDALRFTLAAMASPGRDIKLSEERIEGYRNFVNKLWNAARFILMNLEGPCADIPVADRSLSDRWVMSRLNRCIGAVNNSLEAYRFDEAANTLYHFIWHEYCDWYLELAKPALADKASHQAALTRTTLVESFETVLRLLHPFMPFITEEIWQTFPKPTDNGPSIMIQQYPTPAPEWDAKDVETSLGTLQQFVTLTRTGRNLLNYPPGKSLTLFGVTYDRQEFTRLQSLKPSLEHLSRGSVQLDLKDDRYSDDGLPKDVLRLVVESLTVGLLVEGEVDLLKSIQRMAKQLGEADTERDRITKKLNNPEFMAKAPPEVKEEIEQRLRKVNHEANLLSRSQEQLDKMWRARLLKDP